MSPAEKARENAGSHPTDEASPRMPDIATVKNL